MELQKYLDDGAGFQFKAVLAFVQYLNIGDLKDWKVTRLDPCPECGYTIYRKVYTDSSPVQLNITFCEHRNSDDIDVHAQLKSTVNPPVVEDLWENDGSNLVQYSCKVFKCFEIGRTANYIKGLMDGFDVMVEAKEYSFLPTLINETDPNQN
jgi:hypothetical protein